jgi:hypothetical protein
MIQAEVLKTGGFLPVFSAFTLRLATFFYHILAVLAHIVQQHVARSFLLASAMAIIRS